MKPPHFDGELVHDQTSRQLASEDFGHLLRKLPDGVLRPGSVGDIAAIVQWAATQNMQVCAQASKHSVYGRSQVEDGIVVDMSGYTRIHHVDHDRIVVDAGATWRDVLTGALRQGLTPPVLPEYLDLSVGGTIAAGGIGGTSWRHGTLSDNVLALQVVAGDGHILTCSHDTNTVLFDAVRAGLGQVGIITQATLKLRRAPDSVRRYQLVYPDLDTMLTDQRLLLEEGRWDYLQGAVVPREDGDWIYTIDGSRLFSGDIPADAAMLTGLSDDRVGADISTLDFQSYADRFAPLEEALRSTGSWYSPHPWLFTFVGSTIAPSILATTLADLTHDDLGEFGRVGVFPLRTSAVQSPLFRMPDEQVMFAFNLMRYGPSDCPEAVAAMVKANRAVYEHVHSAGGTLNPVSALPMAARDWREHLGPEWNRMSAAKHAYDPDHLLTPGYEIFASHQG